MKLSIQKINLVIDCTDAAIMADFYSKLLGWEWTHPHSNGWAAITSPENTVIAFQELESYKPPVWPWQEGQQGQMLHLDFLVNNLDEAVSFAIECGAKLADIQYFKTSKTMLDPAGHPFCLDTDGAE
ncbi:MAG: VOC family protein [Dysgonomonas sp.]